MEDCVVKRTFRSMRTQLIHRLRTGVIIDVLFQQNIIDKERETLGTLETTDQVRRLLDILETKDENVIPILIRIIRHDLSGMKDLAQKLQHEYAIARQATGTLVRGKVVKIASIESKNDDKDVIQINLKFLEEILHKLGNKELVILSLNGRTRRGKSFICTNLLKYFLYGLNFEDKDWVYMALNECFTWKQDIEPVTSGIHMFSEPLIIRQNNKEVAVLLLDCQGLHDEQTSNNGNALIFAFSVLLSSIFVLNDTVTSQDVFNDMHMFMQFAKAENSDTNNSTSKLLQKFMFLVRDWNHKSLYKCGYYDENCKPNNQENNLIHQLFGENKNQSAAAKGTRKAIKDLSGEVSAFVMPHPRNNPDPSVDPTDWTLEFRDQIIAFVCKIVSPDFIEQSIKKISGNIITGEELINFVRIWVHALQDSDNLPNINNIMVTTIEFIGNTLISKCKDIYENEMNNIITNNTDGIAMNLFDVLHKEYRSEALKVFHNSTLLGGEKVHKQYEQKLWDAIEYIRKEKLTTNVNSLLTSAEKEKVRALKDRQILQQAFRVAEARSLKERQILQQAFEKLQAEVQKRDADERRLKQEAERKFEQERIQQEAVASEVRRRNAVLIEAVKRGVDDSQKHLERTLTNLDERKKNTAPFVYTATEPDSASPFGLISRQVQKFNQEAYDDGVQRAEYKVQKAEERLEASNLLLKLAQNF